MNILEMQHLVKVYPFQKPGIFAGKRQKEAYQRQLNAPNTTNEGVLAIANLSLTVRKGEFIVILGESGCGKSTLLRMIAGLEDVSDGHIFMKGKDITALRPEERNISMVFQEIALYPQMNVRDNIAYSLRNEHIPREEIDVRVNEVAESLQLSDFLDRNPDELSGGEQQKVSIARAIIRRPSIFLFDEPLSNLDGKNKASLRETIKQLHQQLGTTFIYVTHDQVEALSLADRIVLMREGVIEQVGSPSEVYLRPATCYTAQFIGSPKTNLLDPGKFMIAMPSVKNSKTFMGTGKKKQKYLVGIRPVHVQVDLHGDGFTVKRIECMGAENHLYMVMDGDQEQEEICAVVPPDFGPLMRMQKVGIHFPEEHILFYNKETGNLES